MIANPSSNIIGSAFPYNIGISNAGGTNYYGMFNFRQGLSYSPRVSATTFRDLSIFASNATGPNIVAADYYPNRWGGMVHLNNTTGYNPGAGKYIYASSFAPASNFTYIISWEYVASNTTYGADIIMGAYASSTHDYWIGTSGYGASAYQFFRNGTGVSSGITPVAGRRYIALISNNAASNTGYFYLYSSAGQSYSNAAIGGVTLNTSGSPALGKYGAFNDNYLPNVLIGDWVLGFDTTNCTYAKANAVLQSLKPKLGIP
jgi:hypothetical protein